MIIANIKGEEGMEAVVSQIGAARFSVVLHDVDADLYDDSVRIFPTLEGAMAYAKAIEVSA